MSTALLQTNFNLPGQTGFYRGKVRDVYYLGDIIVMVATDRISAFDHILPEPIPHKGAVLNGVAQYFMEACADSVPNWLIASPDPNVTIGYRCEAFEVEVVIRGERAIVMNHNDDDAVFEGEALQPFETKILARSKGGHTQ